MVKDRMKRLEKNGKEYKRLGKTRIEKKKKIIENEMKVQLGNGKKFSL
jgi:hypothetical protein